MKANISLEELEKTHDKQTAKAIYKKIGMIGGFGDVVGISGGLDLTSLSDKKREEIEALITPAAKDEGKGKPKDGGK